MFHSEEPFYYALNLKNIETFFCLDGVHFRCYLQDLGHSSADSYETEDDPYSVFKRHRTWTGPRASVFGNSSDVQDRDIIILLLLLNLRLYAKTYRQSVFIG